MAVPIIIFDLDGTLVDTAPDLVDALNFVFGREGLPPLDGHAARALIGGGARRMIENALTAVGRLGNNADLDHMFDAFITHYADHIADRSRPFPGLGAALDELAVRGHRFAVCTNKLEWLSVRLLTALGLAGRFVAICGQDTFPVQKPHPDALFGTLRKAGGKPCKAIMVGDSATDISTAKAANVPIVAVDFGYADGDLARLQPDRIISCFNELPTAIEALLDLRAKARIELPGRH
jgi:phosphoglycolate phosphatase